MALYSYGPYRVTALCSYGPMQLWPYVVMALCSYGLYRRQDLRVALIDRCQPRLHWRRQHERDARLGGRARFFKKNVPEHAERRKRREGPAAGSEGGDPVRNLPPMPRPRDRP